MKDLGSGCRSRLQTSEYDGAMGVSGVGQETQGKETGKEIEDERKGGQETTNAFSFDLCRPVL